MVRKLVQPTFYSQGYPGPTRTVPYGTVRYGLARSGSSPLRPPPFLANKAQPSPAQPRPGPAPAQPSPAQPSPARPGPAYPSPAHPSPAQPTSPNPAQVKAHLVPMDKRGDPGPVLPLLLPTLLLQVLPIGKLSHYSSVSDPDLSRLTMSPKKDKKFRIFMFVEFSVWLEASPGARMSFVEA